MNKVYGPYDETEWRAMLACRDLMPWYLNRGAVRLFFETKQNYYEIMLKAS